MLVLTRKPEEKIIIGNEDKIVITILKVQGGKVSVGIQADKKWQIVREELLDDNEKEQEDSKQQFSGQSDEECEEEAVPAEQMELAGALTN
jgi:carbon storage regulator